MDASMRMRQLPPIWQVLLLEFPLLFAALLAVISTGFQLVRALIGTLFVWTSWDDRVKLWRALPQIWQPYLQHFKVYVLYLRGQKAKTMREQGERRVAVYEGRWQPSGRSSWSFPEFDFSLDLEEIFVGTWLALELGVPATLIGFALVYGAPAALVVTVYNAKAPIIPEKPLVAPSFIPSEMQRQEVDFGPWVATADVTNLRHKAGVNNFALLSDTGEARYSAKWTIDPKDPAWQPSVNPMVTISEIKGSMVTFKDSRQPPNTFNLNVGQPFQFENVAAIVFVFQADGLKQAKREDVKPYMLSQIKSLSAPNAQLTR